MYDPKDWFRNRNYSMDQISNLYTHFKIPLDACNLELDAALRKWKNLCMFVSTNYRGLEARLLWEKIFQYKRRRYENICLLEELIMSLSGSNSTVEKAFSLLTLLMSDRQLKLAHNTTENLMIININDKLRASTEREEIVVKAAQKYEDAKKRVRTFDKPPEKHLVIENEDDDDGSDSDDQVDEEESATRHDEMNTNEFFSDEEV